MMSCAMANRVILLLFLISFCGNSSFAQARDSAIAEAPKNKYYKRAYLGFSIGVAYPMGSFSAKNEEFDNSAFAESGFNLHYIEGGYRIGKTLGVAAYLFTKTNSIDYDLLRKSRTSKTGNSYIEASGGDYELRGAMLGLLVSKKNDVVDLDLRFMLGNAGFYLPEVKLKYRDQTSNQIHEQRFRPTQERSFGVGLGAGMRIHLKDYLDLMLNGTYLLFQNDFTQVVEEGPNLSEVKSELNYEVVNLNIGLAYRFITE